LRDYYGTNSAKAAAFYETERKQLLSRRLDLSDEFPEKSAVTSFTIEDVQALKLPAN
jgi:hypothetical protein